MWVRVPPGVRVSNAHKHKGGGMFDQQKINLIKSLGILLVMNIQTAIEINKNRLSYEYKDATERRINELLEVMQ